MHFTKVFALAAFFAGAAIAAPYAEPEPNNPKPPKPSPNPPSQQNACNNGAQAYCCTADGKGSYTSCYAYQFTNQCSQLAVCCNNNAGTQTCIGGAQVITPPYYPYP